MDATGLALFEKYTLAALERSSAPASSNRRLMPNRQLRSPLSEEKRRAQLALQLAVPPRGVVPAEPPHAAAAISCVEFLVSTLSTRFEMPEPGVRWYVQPPSALDRTKGAINHGEDVVWLNTGYSSPQDLARTVAHELVRRWQDFTRGRCRDADEHGIRESEAHGLARRLVPRGAYPTPRGRALNLWFDPASPRYRRFSARPRAPSQLDTMS